MPYYSYRASPTPLNHRKTWTFPRFNNPLLAFATSPRAKLKHCLLCIKSTLTSPKLSTCSTTATAGAFECLKMASSAAASDWRANALFFLWYACRANTCLGTSCPFRPVRDRGFCNGHIHIPHRSEAAGCVHCLRAPASEPRVFDKGARGSVVLIC